MLQHVMEPPPKPTRPSRKKRKTLEVHVMFEPSRLEQECLQQAYAHLIPAV
ncbi:hypothetical protein [Ktedonobacter sp. SOSP1-85]|uniref:hypothetical protein n=1 Tax=Ktedonobacter sp. SOSP1-85 TaxID=2778367 RepID=UPI001F3F4E1E|nr:hypothetical protein [Ktedonobacter sp. SOSP1-85]